MGMCLVQGHIPFFLESSTDFFTMVAQSSNSAFLQCFLENKEK